MENNVETVTIRTRLKSYEHVSARIISEKKKDIQAMIDDSTYHYELKIQNKDIESFKNQLEAARQNRTEITIISKSAYPHEQNLYVNNFDNSNDKNTFTIILTTAPD